MKKQTIQQPESTPTMPERKSMRHAPAIEKRAILAKQIAKNIAAQMKHGRAIGIKAYTTACACGTSMLALPIPLSHCPHCHKTWELRKNKAATLCPVCKFSLHHWRLRQGIEVLDAGEIMPKPQPAVDKQTSFAEQLAS